MYKHCILLVNLSLTLLGGKHSDSSMTTARSKMLDKIERQDMQAINLNGDFRVHYPHDHL